MMFKLLKKIFRVGVTTAATKQAGTSAMPSSISTPSGIKAPEAAPGVEVATLSLRAILEKLPNDLKSSINQMPEDTAKVVLPVNTIMKQLPTGTVKMSLASIHRQAPNGIFRKGNIEEKRMVEVPLAEIFKTINVGRLQRRAQRDYVVPDDIQGLFGNSGTSHTVAPAQPAPVPEDSTAAGEAPKVLKMPTLAPAPSSPSSSSSVSKPEPTPQPSAALTPPMALKLDGTLSLPFLQIAAAWNEEIRDALSVLPGDTNMVIPVSEVGPGLQKGKVHFTWAQLRNWLTPDAPANIKIPDETVLALPLKIVAPAFVAATGASKRTSQSTAVNEKLPDFFGPSAGKVPVAPPAPAPADPPAEKTAPAPSPPPAPALSFSAESVTTPPTPSVSIPAPHPSPPPPSTAPSAPSVISAAEPGSLAELFNKPGQTEWTPNDLVKYSCELPSVIGVVIALEEGLVVAQKLPESLSPDTFAAFMPQIFSRLDKYTGEMQLGETADISITTAGGPCQLYRRGKVYIAFLGQASQKLPAGLSLIAHEISTQNS